jgi:hypothetical protein
VRTVCGCGSYGLRGLEFIKVVGKSAARIGEVLVPSMVTCVCHYRWGDCTHLYQDTVVVMY